MKKLIALVIIILITILNIPNNNQIKNITVYNNKYLTKEFKIRSVILWLKEKKILII